MTWVSLLIVIIIIICSIFYTDGICAEMVQICLWFDHSALDIKIDLKPSNQLIYFTPQHAVTSALTPWHKFLHSCVGQILSYQYDDSRVERVDVKKWAPQVWLAPDEEFYPSSVDDFLKNVQPFSPDNPIFIPKTLPVGPQSKSWFLSSKLPVEILLSNKSSMIYGMKPENNKVSAPVYTTVTVCNNSTYHFITYWMFFPYNKGKDVCTANLGKLGSWPSMKIHGVCLGSMQQFGNHIGDWEHTSILFKDENTPTQMYISAHEVGAFYKYRPISKTFSYQRQEVRNSGNVHPEFSSLQRAKFPKYVKLVAGTHPLLFAAAGSHGLWAEPGQHKFLRIPRLYDESGYGTSWDTWNSVSVVKLEPGTPWWMQFMGRWGNPKNDCHPLVENICKQSDGPFGIPMNKHHFKCS